MVYPPSKYVVDMRNTFYFNILTIMILISGGSANAAPRWMSTVCDRLLTVEYPSPRILPAGTPVAPYPEPQQAAPGQRKVVIITSGVGMGHNAAARAIEQAIQGKDPGTLIKTIEIEDLQNPFVTRVEQSTFWAIIKKAPWIYDIAYKRFMNKARKQGLSGVRQNVDQSVLEEFIDREKPDVIVSAHQMTATGLALMRQKGLLKNTRIAFVATDYFVEFLPEVSKALDFTLVPHPMLIPEWLKQGVSPEKVDSTGMPVHPEAFKPVDRAEFLSARNLDPNVTTITLASGGEGVGNYPKIVRSLTEAYSSAGKKLQLVAICGKNEAHVKALNKMKAKLREKGVELTVLGFTKQPEMFGYIKSSDLYITKSGGLSPSEGFAMHKPMILLDVYGGHERVNAKFFESIGVALINRDQGAIGTQVMNLLADSAQKAKMLEAQAEVTKLQNFSKIAAFVVPENK